MPTFEIVYLIIFVVVVALFFHAWFGLKNLWVLALVLIGLTLMANFSEYLRGLFGVKYGNIVVSLLIFSGAAVLSVKYLSTISKKREAIAGLCLLVAVLFAFLAWFIHPSRILERADNRLEDARAALKKHVANEKAAVAEEREKLSRYYLAEFEAAEFEYKAVRVRSDLSLEAFNDTTSIKLLWLCSFLSLLCGVWSFCKIKKVV